MVGSSSEADGSECGESPDLLGELHRLQMADPRQLRRLGKALIQLAEALKPLDGYVLANDPVPVQPPISDAELAVAAKSILAFRRRRKAIFPADLFAEPAWDLLLDLFVNAVAGQRNSTKSLCAAAELATATGLRWLGVLEAKGLIRRWTPPDDNRVSAVQMTSEGYARMRDLLTEWFVGSNRDRLWSKSNTA